MKITIDEAMCEKEGLTLAHVLAMCIVKTGVDVKALFNELIQMEAFVEDDANIYITQRYSDLCDEIILGSEQSKSTKTSIENTAKKLMEIFPKGKKPGTNYYWKGNLREITLKLSKFYKLYGDKYSQEEIVNATEKYVNTYKNDPSFMRLLKYFILKDDTSDLATFIENSGQDEENIGDWMTKLV